MGSVESKLATIRQKLEAVTKRGYVILSDGTPDSAFAFCTLNNGPMVRQLCFFSDWLQIHSFTKFAP